jgi:hypothetical protein
MATLSKRPEPRQDARDTGHVQSGMSTANAVQYGMSAVSGQPIHINVPGFVQRKCAHCEEEEKLQRKPSDTFLQRKENGAAIAGDALSGKITASKGSGNDMDAGTLNFMEERIGADFSGVKIHTGSEAVQMSRELNAQAFTVGSDIYFNENKYDPSSSEGKHLLAHELTHTMQQGQAIQPKIQKRDMQFNPSLIAVQLRNAMDGWGTDEEAIYAALAGRTTAEVELISSAYQTLTGRGLQADLQDELTASELLRVAQFSQFASDTPDNRAMAVAIQLRDAMKGWGTDENAIYVALQSRSQAELNLIRTAYNTLTSRQLMDDLRDELTDEEYTQATGTMGISPVQQIQNTELGMLSMGNFDYRLNNCRIEIEVRLKFQFTDDIIEADRNAFKPRFINAIQSKWQHSGYKLVGGISCPCEEIPITVNAVENDSDYHKIVDVEDKSESDRRPMVVSDINVNLHTASDTFAHEFGHVLGLYDEYDGGFWENIMFWHQNRPDDPGSLMNTETPDGTDGLRPRFFEHYKRAANETAPMDCNYMVSH